jgi:hypothetical protein
LSIQRSKHVRSQQKSEGCLPGEKAWFEADRKALLLNLMAVEKAMEEGATEMKMIAGENVFDSRVSKILAGESRDITRMVRQLTDLRREVALARYLSAKNSANPISSSRDRKPHRRGL